MKVSEREFFRHGRLRPMTRFAGCEQASNLAKRFLRPEICCKAVGFTNRDSGIIFGDYMANRYCDRAFSFRGAKRS